MEKTKQPPTLTEAGKGEAFAIAGDSYRIVIAGTETEGAFAVIDMLIPPGGGPPPHAHPDFQESFYVLEGEVELTTEAGKLLARQGDFVNIPRGGIIHCFKNKTDKIAHLWCTVVPAGLDGLFKETGEPAAFGTFLPPPPMDAEGMKKVQAIAAKYGQTIYPPDYLDK